MMVLFATTATDDGVADARAWIKHHSITSDEARLVKREDMVLVIDKGATWRRLKPTF